jgi:predicted glycogen debranching enzyme
MDAPSNQSVSALPAPIVVDCRGKDMGFLLGREWLLTNRIGAYASSTVIGCNTRRYHGLLVGATRPPVGRIVALSTVMEQLIVAGKTYDLATNEFPDAFSPHGLQHLVEFRNDVAPAMVFRMDGVELVKEIILAESSSAVAVRYTLQGAPAVLSLRPFTALRDYHGLRSVSQPHQMTFEATQGGVVVQDRMQATPALFLIGQEAQFQGSPQWWYRFRYRGDIARGQEGFEDIYTPGCFLYQLASGQSCQFTGSLKDPHPLGFQTTLARRRERMGALAWSLGPGADETERRLAVASDAFVVQRSFPGGPASETILAGYHWFADWGRDAMISLPGLLLTTRRFEQARQVFRTFAGNLWEGLIPNRFDDHASVGHYNSIDASLWFIIAAERYVAATGDMGFWREVLMPAADAILTAYHNGTQFDIRADGDGLLTGGSPNTQLTWMDVALAGAPVTPRHGKAVEVNALWHSAHCIMGRRCRGGNDALADRYEHLASLMGPVFRRTFWNARYGWLNDCVTESGEDASFRPNQILAVSLPHCPLEPQQQQTVVRVVTEKLLTPFGLLTLSPEDPRYRRGYGGSWESRDRAYHQGTVWPWLIGPFIEAYLKVEGNKPPALAQARRWLSAFDGHLHEAGLGFISEIFDADGPQEPHGCIAQAWSVAEVLRAKQLVAQGEKR